MKEGGGTISTETGVLGEAPWFRVPLRKWQRRQSGRTRRRRARALLFDFVFPDAGVAGPTPERIGTHADITLDKVGEGFEIESSHLTATAKSPGATAARFQDIAATAKTGCPVSKRLKAKITIDARLES